MKNIILLLTALLVLNSCDLLTSKLKETNKKKEIQNEKAVVSKLKNGIKKYYFKTGELKSTVQYKDNRKIGVSETFYKSGEKQYDIPYVEGMKHGTVKWYYKSGKVYRETEYKRGKKTGYQKKYWENNKLKSEIQYKDNLARVGLKEYNKLGKEKSTPYIKVEKIDLTKKSGEYVLKFRLSNSRKKVQFYQGKLIDGKFFPTNGKGFIELKTSAGVGEIRFNVSAGFNLDKKIHVIAVESTLYQNKRILVKTVPVAVQNPK